VGLTTLPCKKKIVEKPPRNSAGFCGGGQGLSWAVEPRKEEEFTLLFIIQTMIEHYIYIYIYYLVNDARTWNVKSLFRVGAIKSVVV
jgi:hypothetical protein